MRMAKTIKIILNRTKKLKKWLRDINTDHINYDIINSVLWNICKRKGLPTKTRQRNIKNDCRLLFLIRLRSTVRPPRSTSNDLILSFQALFVDLFIQNYYYTHIKHILSWVVRFWWYWWSRALSIVLILESFVNNRVCYRVFCMWSNLSSTTRVTTSIKRCSLPFVSCPYYWW